MQTPDVENGRPGSSGFSRNESMKHKRRSVFFSKEDASQDIPSLPVTDLINELQSRHGKTLYAAEFINAVEEADTNGDGLISIPELISIIESMNNLKKENTGLKQYLGVAVGSLLLMLLAIFGLVFGVVKLTQEISTGDGNALVSKSTGMIVDVHPSDGGGIFLDMGAFTEPLNISFPALRVTEVCVGQISADAINAHYKQFTTGGSHMTIRHIDYSRSENPAVYTHIPASNIDVSAQGDSNAAATDAALEATMAIKKTMEAFEGNGEDRRRLGRALSNIMEGAKTQQQAEEQQQRSNGVGQTSGTIVSGKGNGAAFGKNRRLEEEIFDLVTVDDYMKSFASQNHAISFTKDNELTEDYYFVCLAPEPTATN